MDKSSMSFAIEKSPIIGRYMVATRDIPAGELILKETSILSAPYARSGIRSPLCLACYKFLKTSSENDGENWCSRCKWPMHRSCQDNPVHREFECEVFSKNYVLPESTSVLPVVYPYIMVLRGVMLRDKDTRRWFALLDLDSSRDARLSSEGGKIKTKSVMNFVNGQCKQNFPEWDIDHILGVMQTNAFVNSDKEIMSGCYLFPVGSMASHSCIPSMKWSVAPSHSEMRMSSLRPIKKGEVLDILYTIGMTGTLARQKCLTSSKFFTCTCKRCQDPTECGSYFSALNCTTCKKGYLLPQYPLEVDSQWVCDNGDCRCIRNHLAVRWIVTAAREEHEIITYDCTCNNVTTAKKLVDFLSKIQKVFHPHHYFIHEVEQDTIQRLLDLLAVKMNLDGPNNLENDMKIQGMSSMSHTVCKLARKGMKIMDMMLPGLIQYRGKQLYYLLCGMKYALAEKDATTTTEIVIGTKEEFHEKKKEALRIFKDTEDAEGTEAYEMTQLLNDQHLI